VSLAAYTWVSRPNGGFYAHTPTLLASAALHPAKVLRFPRRPASPLPPDLHEAAVQALCGMFRAELEKNSLASPGPGVI